MNSPVTKIEDYRPPTGTIPYTSWTPTFVHSVADMKARVEDKRRFMREVMIPGEHYGKPPGMEDRKDVKPALLKAGAELLLSSYGLSAELLDAEPAVRDYDGSQHGGTAMIAYRERCRVYKQIGPTDNERVLIAQADGFCSSRETKYRYRDGSRKCVTCGKATIIKGKEEWGGGWICHLKKGGCGEKYLTSDQRIASQQVGRIENPDIADQENTILKMSQKRAYVAATLLATGCSDIFTQDTEDMDVEEMQNVTPRSTSNVREVVKAQSMAQEPAMQADHINATGIAFIEKLWVNLPASTRYAIVAKTTGGRTDDLRDVTVEEGRLIARELLPPKKEEPSKNEPPTPVTPTFALKQQMPQLMDYDALESIRGNVPMIDARALAITAQQCGMDEEALRAFIFGVTGKKMLTSGVYREVLAAMDQRVAECENA